MYTYIPLLFENKEVKLGSATWSLNTALRKALATNSNTAKNPQTRVFQPRQLRDRRKKMEGHIVGTGFLSPLPLRPNVLVRLAHDGHRWIDG